MAMKALSSLRVAFEGCVSSPRRGTSLVSTDYLQGHGCLHDIYSSVEKAASLKGWDNVDLVVIGGDFQVRHRRRLFLFF